MEWLVEMTKRIVSDRRMRQIHNHCPECAAYDGALLRQLGHRLSPASRTAIANPFSFSPSKAMNIPARAMYWFLNPSGL